MSKRSRPVPDEARQLSRDEFEKWCEKAGRFEDDGHEGHVADQRALWMIYDQRWKEKTEGRETGIDTS